MCDMRAIEFSAMKFGAVAVLYEVGPYLSPGGHRDRQFRCRCDCGKEWSVRSAVLRRGITSCGCILKPALQHEHARKGQNSPTYRVWAGIVQRCTNPKNGKFSHYGGRGIQVCARWKESFEAFLADMGERPAGLTIERIDNEGDYEPLNCRWATVAEQGRNRRNNVIVGDELLIDAAARLSLSHSAISQRMRRGWSRERAFTTPRWHKSKNPN